MLSTSLSLFFFFFCAFTRTQDDRIFKIRSYNDAGEFAFSAEVIVNKRWRLPELRAAMFASFGVPTDRQVLTEVKSACKTPFSIITCVRVCVSARVRMFL